MPAISVLGDIYQALRLRDSEPSSAIYHSLNASYNLNRAVVRCPKCGRTMTVANRYLRRDGARECRTCSNRRLGKYRHDRAVGEMLELLTEDRMRVFYAVYNTFFEGLLGGAYTELYDKYVFHIARILAKKGLLEEDAVRNGRKVSEGRKIAWTYLRKAFPELARKEISFSEMPEGFTGNI